MYLHVYIAAVATSIVSLREPQHQHQDDVNLCEIAQRKAFDKEDMGTRRICREYSNEPWQATLSHINIDS